MRGNGGFERPDDPDHRLIGLSFVVVAWNSAPELRPLLASIERHINPPYEVIIVDNASDDDGAALGEEWDGPSTVIRLPENRGFGAGSNAGVRAARYDVVVLLNPDTLLIDTSLVQLAELARETRALCGPQLLDQNGSRQPSASPLPAGWEVGVQSVIPGALMPRWLSARCEPSRSPSTVAVGWLTGACLAGPRDVLMRLGPFDEQIHLYSEDMDLGIRANAAGVLSLYAPDVARVVHISDRSAARRFTDAGLELSIHNRRRVVTARYGRGRERYDITAQIASHGIRFVAKRLLRRDSSREEQWLKTAARVLREPKTF